MICFYESFLQSARGIFKYKQKYFIISQIGLFCVQAIEERFFLNLNAS